MVINIKTIIGLVKIEERIYDFFKLITSNFNDDTNIFYLNNLKMFLSKEERIISEIPINDREFNNYILGVLDDIVINNLDNSDNYVFILSRISNFFQDCNINIEPDSQFAYDFDGEYLYVKDNYVESIYNVNSRKYYKSLIVRYLRQIEDLKDLGIYDNNLLEIQKYNLYIERDLFGEYVSSQFDIHSLKCFSDDDIRMKFCYDEEMFFRMKNDVICDKLFDLVITMFNCSSDTMNYLDAELNFKYFISELPYEVLVNFVSEFDNFLNDYCQKSDKNIFDYKNIISRINKYLDEELSRKNTKNKESLLSEYDYNRLCNFVSLEKEIISLIHKLDFEKSDLLNVKKIDLLLDIEEDLVKDLKDIPIMNLNYFFTVLLSKILNDNNLFDLINYRVFHLFPVFNILFKNPGQSNESFEMINRNYVISCIKDYYVLVNNIDDEDTKKSFCDVYKNQFYKNPFLTRLLILLGGNHLIIEPSDIEVSSELSCLSDFEYRYDINQQLFPEAVDLIQKLSTDIQNNFNAYFDFWLIQFNCICRYLSNEYLSSLYELLLDGYQDSSCFSILTNIVCRNLNGIDYDIDVLISSFNIKGNVLKLGGKKDV